MSKPFTNFWNRLVWKVKRSLSMDNMPISPIQWGPVLPQASPSSHFIQSLSQEQKQKMDIIEKEVQLFSRLQRYFPPNITERSWKILLECQTTKERYDHIKFCSRNAKLRLDDKKKKEAAISNEASKVVSEHINTMWSFSPINRHKWERNATWNRSAIAFRLNEGPKLAVDCRFFPDLSPRGADLTAIQLKYLVSENRDHQYPLQMYFVNYTLDKSGKYNFLHEKHLAILNSPNNAGPVVSSSNYTELFDRSKIVYLSPHAEEEIEQIEDDTIYVLGGIVDRIPEKGIPNNASAITAERDGVVMKKLPLDKYITWKSGTKYLTLTAMSNILHDVYHSNGDWDATLRKHIPARNVKAAEEKSIGGRLLAQRIRVRDMEILSIVEKELAPYRLV